MVGGFQQRKRARKTLVGRVRRDTDRRGDVNTGGLIRAMISTRQRRENSLRDWRARSRGRCSAIATMTIPLRRSARRGRCRGPRPGWPARSCAEPCRRLGVPCFSLISLKRSRSICATLKSRPEHHGLRELAIEHAIQPRPVEHAGERVAAARVFRLFGARLQGAGRGLQVGDFLQGMQIPDCQ